MTVMSENIKDHQFVFTYDLGSITEMPRLVSCTEKVPLVWMSTRGDLRLAPKADNIKGYGTPEIDSTLNLFHLDQLSRIPSSPKVLTFTYGVIMRKISTSVESFTPFISK